MQIKIVDTANTKASYLVAITNDTSFNFLVLACFLLFFLTLNEVIDRSCGTIPEPNDRLGSLLYRGIQNIMTASWLNEKIFWNLNGISIYHDIEKSSYSVFGAANLYALPPNLTGCELNLCLKPYMAVRVYYAG